jgi:hypothetical protein
MKIIQLIDAHGKHFDPITDSVWINHNLTKRDKFVAPVMFDGCENAEYVHSYMKKEGYVKMNLQQVSFAGDF